MAERAARTTKKESKGKSAKGPVKRPDRRKRDSNPETRKAGNYLHLELAPLESLRAKFVNQQMTAHGPISANIPISDANDRHEREADSVARTVMGQTSQPDGARAASLRNQRRPIPISRMNLSPLRRNSGKAMSTLSPFSIQRKCNECENSQARPLHGVIPQHGQLMRKSAEPASRRKQSDAVNRKVKHALASMESGGGKPLSRSDRTFLETRMGHDLSAVRVHNDARAADAAEAINARAFTVGNHIAFNRGEYQAETQAGRRLLAHEATHTIQQGRNGRAIQRELKVHDPDAELSYGRKGWTNAKIIDSYIQKLCPTFHVVGGRVVPKDKTAKKDEPGKLKKSCECVGYMHGLFKTWWLHVSDVVGPHTDPQPENAFIKTSLHIYVPSPFSIIEYGAWSKGKEKPRRLNYKGKEWLILAHELCGHAQQEEKNVFTGSRPGMARPGHDHTISIENEIAKEHGAKDSELRGTFTGGDKHGGESFGKITINFPRGSADVAALPPVEKFKLELMAKFFHKNYEYYKKRFKSSDIADRASHVYMDFIGYNSRSESKSLAQKRAQNVSAALKEVIERWRGGKKTIGPITIKAIQGDACPTEPCGKADMYFYTYPISSVKSAMERPAGGI